jgi:hypothetical protein
MQRLLNSWTTFEVATATAIIEGIGPKGLRSSRANIGIHPTSAASSALAIPPTPASVAVGRPQLFRRMCYRNYGSFVAQRMDRLGACDRQRVPEDCRQRDKKCCCSRSKKR